MARMAPHQKQSSGRDLSYWISDRRRANPGKTGPALTYKRFEETKQLRLLIDRVCADRAGDIARMSDDLVSTLQDDDPAGSLMEMDAVKATSQQLDDLLWLRAVFMNNTYPQIARRVGMSRTRVGLRIERAGRPLCPRRKQAFGGCTRDLVERSFPGARPRFLRVGTLGSRLRQLTPLRATAARGSKPRLHLKL